MADDKGRRKREICCGQEIRKNLSTITRAGSVSEEICISKARKSFGGSREPWQMTKSDEEDIICGQEIRKNLSTITRADSVSEEICISKARKSFGGSREPWQMTKADEEEICFGQEIRKNLSTITRADTVASRMETKSFGCLSYLIGNHHLTMFLFCEEASRFLGKNYLGGNRKQNT